MRRNAPFRANWGFWRRSHVWIYYSKFEHFFARTQFYTEKSNKASCTHRRSHAATLAQGISDSLCGCNVLEAYWSAKFSGPPKFSGQEVHSPQITFVLIRTTHIIFRIHRPFRNQHQTKDDSDRTDTQKTNLTWSLLPPHPWAFAAHPISKRRSSEFSLLCHGSPQQFRNHLGNTFR